MYHGIVECLHAGNRANIKYEWLLPASVANTSSDSLQSLL